MNVLGYTADFLGWPALQISIGYAATRLPSSFFARECWITAPRRWERDGRLYTKRMAIRRWKHLLPDGASWFGGFPKKRLASRDRIYLQKFALETRRSEIAHWCMLCCVPLFFFWNPAWAGVVMAGYGIAANLPCIIVQRYNRRVLLHLSQSPLHAAVTR